MRLHSLYVLDFDTHCFPAVQFRLPGHAMQAGVLGALPSRATSASARSPSRGQCQRGSPRTRSRSRRRRRMLMQAVVVASWGRSWIVASGMRHGRHEHGFRRVQRPGHSVRVVPSPAGPATGLCKRLAGSQRSNPYGLACFLPPFDALGTAMPVHRGAVAPHHRAGAPEAVAAGRARPTPPAPLSVGPPG